MQGIRALGTDQNDPAPISIKALAATVGLGPAISVTELVSRLQMPVRFHANIVTPPGTALGGTVDLTLCSDGRYSFNVHMHDSGADPYSFRVRCAVTTPGGIVLIFQTTGHTDGTGSNLLGTLHRDFDHQEDDHNQLIQMNWLDVRAGTMSVSKSYEDVGALSTIEDLAKDLLGFLIADVTLGASLALVIAVSVEASKAAGANLVGPGGLVGVAVAGGIVWAFGPSAIVAAVVAGVAAGAATDALIRHRQIDPDEYAFAQLVFNGTLPPIEKIYVTNLSNPDHERKFTWPNIDGNILLNLGDAFDNPVYHAEGDGGAGDSYVTPGQAFIHELTHAWQIARLNFVPGLICRYVTGGASYTLRPPNSDWHRELGIEEQARIVDYWFGKYGYGWTDIVDLKNKLNSQAAANDPYFHYIAQNIRLAQD